VISNPSFSLLNSNRASAGLSPVNPGFAKWWSEQIDPAAGPSGAFGPGGSNLAAMQANRQAEVDMHQQRRAGMAAQGLMAQQFGLPSNRSGMQQRNGMNQYGGGYFGNRSMLNPDAFNWAQNGGRIGHPLPQTQQAQPQHQQFQQQPFDLIQMLGNFYQPTSMGNAQDNANSTVGANFIGHAAPPRRF
jgi:hypothetical protein